MSTADYLLWLCRWLIDGAALWLWGSALFLLALVPADLRMRIWQEQAVAYRRARLAILLATLCVLPLHSAILTDGWADSWQPATLLSVAGDTGMGQAWCWQLAAALTLWLSGRHRAGVSSPGLTTLTGASVLASLTLSGHAAMHGGGLGLAHRFNDLLHLLSSGAWLGALPLVRQLLRQPAPAPQTVLRQIMLRFSSIGHGVVLVVIASGLGNLYLINGSLLPDSSSPYTTLLGLKLLMVAGMTLLALYNRYHLVPRMARDAHALPCFRRAVRVQIALSLLALALLASLGTLDPH
ncbi:copper homeostasis membrane protein CopD [Aquitalea denitrificans]|uniref:copper homeostasis membrane protein CopD n=1 Tax=Aquitalea denitrificans TaxID=519081 RepID=UPI00135C69C2|nr:copper homeostasis membrane protein CopD [Aquitalea denitrificans]